MDVPEEELLCCLCHEDLLKYCSVVGVSYFMGKKSLIFNLFFGGGGGGDFCFLHVNSVFYIYILLLLFFKSKKYFLLSIRNK